MVQHEQTITTLTTGEVAWLFNAHCNTVRRWANEGILKASRIGRRGDRRFRRDDVARLLDKLGA